MGCQASRRILLLATIVVAASLPPPSAAQTASCADLAFSGGRLYAACSPLEELDASVHWTYHASNGTADVAFRVPGGSAGWAAWAINPSAVGMLGANTVFAYHNPATGVVAVATAVVDSYAPAFADGDLAFAVYRRGAEYTDGVYAIHATVALPGNSTRQNIVWQAGTSSPDGLPESHQAFGDNVMSSRSWDFRSAEAAVVVDDVPAAPRDSVYRALLRPKNIHGVLNAVSWGVLLPLGVMLARYMRVFPSLDPAWFYLHVACQCSGYVVGSAGWVFGLTLGSPAKGALQHHGHRNIGTALFVLSTLQVSALLIRPKKTVKVRFYWNLYHWSVGYTVVVLGVVNVFKGIGILQADQKYRHAYLGAVLVLAVVAFVLELVTLTVRFKKGRR
ncbi:hypothetical protein CFC21_016254 [Triticum aestivum]|uniref:Cytochrome b561 and DOMON domain-containing protein n=2 Tax=Triticum aestivum TaxID=4565 RepID=A0A9R1J0Y9_WHEAT|nr:cytochrome b561 and DOMON domain-containing protein At4g12980-like [Triticum dicoccoides]XP_044453006.1 cytochrome b561 and DOMON domain-containing protein At4g12980-like [Triticum aestivum]KAF7000320.1 hypothetical protein CFC21_016249 [Triticum aestivum]KAF7000325.1 hypothetical protein CFC21_016254 [Triticum aestivum]